MNNLFTTTKVRTIARAAIASAIGSAIAWGAIKWGKLNTGSLAILAPAISSSYYAAIHYLEIKFPQLGWLLGMLPLGKPKNKPVPTPAPAPASHQGEVPALPQKSNPTARKPKPVAKKVPAKKAEPKASGAKKKLR
jgi:hypothetical protein